MRSMQGKVAVITGSGSGIGRATALRLARAGCRLALADIDAETNAQAAAEAAALGAAVSTHTVDVADKAQMAALPEAVLAAHGAAHIVVNNAGVMVFDPVAAEALDDFEWLFATNFWGVVYGCTFFLPTLRRAGEGHIVNLSSMFGFYGLPTQGAYCASKFAVRGFTESLRAELTGSGIGVTAMHPGAIRTNIFRSARAQRADHRALLQQAQLQMDRFGTAPERVAAKIESAIRHNRARVRVGLDAYLSDGLTRLYPPAISTLMGRVWKRFGAH
ncbi:MAG: putative short chain dehydrogenase/reductase [Pseudomonadota bacterium]|jgi:NAD(P)-dependent dehydrogenase (short-subunit alcohol dehydrogenase family)